ncbi:MAG: hypothetical protein NZ583_03230 [Desulfobacterota bacterium]|nr:hypothetical protein [Thermodesulfobacteriota bacterium]
MLFIKCDGKVLALRKYVHGGLLRLITRDNYFSEKRAIRELSVLFYLKERGFICPTPYCAIVKRGLLFKKLYLITERIENSKPFLEVLKETRGLRRARYIYSLARLLAELYNLRLFHPDFHLLNILAIDSKKLCVLDFDRAKLRMSRRPNDLVKMILRLHRHVRAFEKKGELYLEKKEKVLLLRACGRMIGFDLFPYLKKNLKKEEILQDLGSFVESLVYRNRK